MSTSTINVPLGGIYQTPGVLHGVNAVDVLTSLNRHRKGDWGDVPPEDAESNNIALNTDGRLISSYKDREGKKFWIITEADRSTTTVLLPEEY